LYSIKRKGAIEVNMYKVHCDGTLEHLLV